MKNTFTPATVLLPESGNFTPWSVIACDQFSSEKDYWERVKKKVGDQPSTLNMIIPEAYLGELSMESAAPSRAEAMDRYLSEGVFAARENAFVYVERVLSDGGIRRGIVGKLDLEAYDYRPDTMPPARASERTVVERLPCRIRVREIASLEMPHVLVLIDDPDRSVIEPLTEQKSTLPLAYDFELMEGGGRIEGRWVEGAAADAVVCAVDELGKREVQFVIGDGNHSLAAAKDLWRRLREDLSEEERQVHPARWALVEVCNVYDEGIAFEPIHRIVFHTDPEAVLARLEAEAGDADGKSLAWLYHGKRGEIRLKYESLGAFIGAIQKVLDEVEKEGLGTVDYIHDDKALIALAEEENSLALFLPSMEKNDLFATVEKSGVFPKKSFSIGHARDKRYYTECRRIKPE